MVNLNQDFRDMIIALNEEDVQYLVVGAYAMAQFGYIRATGDIDFFINPTLENSKKAFEALKKFGAPSFSINDDYFSKAGNILQIGVPPLRIDFMTQIDGVSFPDAFKTACDAGKEPENFKIISLENLILNKEATNRDKDKIDANRLRELLRKSQKKES